MSSYKHKSQTHISIFVFDDNDAAIIVHWILWQSSGILRNEDFYVYLPAIEKSTESTKTSMNMNCVAGVVTVSSEAVAANVEDQAQP